VANKYIVSYFTRSLSSLFDKLCSQSIPSITVDFVPFEGTNDELQNSLGNSDTKANKHEVSAKRRKYTSSSVRPSTVGLQGAANISKIE
jgi:hypothetical protein